MSWQRREMENAGDGPDDANRQPDERGDAEGDEEGAVEVLPLQRGAFARGLVEKAHCL
jgi:hypothetical protein